MVEPYATIAPDGLAVAAALAAALAAAIAGYATASLRGKKRLGRSVSTPDEAAGAAAEEQQAIGRYHAAVDGLLEALMACESSQRRLLRVADTAAALGQALTRCHELGLVAKGISLDQNARAPWELHREGPRLPVTAWQESDRAFDALMATLDDRGADLLAEARVFSDLATAARQVADALARSDFSSALAKCTFCGKHGTDVRTVISCPYALICDGCVELCVQIIEDEIGPDWRSPRRRSGAGLSSMERTALRG